MKIILDTNIFVSALLRDSVVRELVVNSPLELVFPEVILDELREHEEELLEKSGLLKDEYQKLINKLLAYVKILPTEILKPCKENALRIIGAIDKDDAIFFAAALFIKDAVIWSDDKQLKKQKEVIVQNTKEIIQLFKQLTS